MYQRADFLSKTGRCFMRIAVLVKQVPDTDEVKIDEIKGVLVREGTGAIINPLDLHALESALSIKRSEGASVSVLTMGPKQADEALREALALGADEAFLLSDPAFAGSDTWATARVLASALGVFGPYDLVLAGEKATDGETGQVGPEVAVMCGVPFCTFVSSFRMSGSFVNLVRTVEEGTESQRISLPCLLTVLRDINEPAMPTLAGKMRARRTDIREVDAAAINVETSSVGLAGSPTRVVRIFRPKVTRKTEHFEGENIDAGIGRFIEVLKERSLL
jgi:electron transfer flavoprotein beta subunit